LNLSTFSSGLLDRTTILLPISFALYLSWNNDDFWFLTIRKQDLTHLSLGQKSPLSV
jgi:hypothetical protein